MRPSIQVRKSFFAKPDSVHRIDAMRPMRRLGGKQKRPGSKTSNVFGRKVCAAFVKRKPRLVVR